MYGEDECCETKVCCNDGGDYEAKTQKMLPEALLLAKRLSKEFGFDPDLCIHTACNHLGISDYTIRKAVLRLGLL